MHRNFKAFCPRCGREMQKFGPTQNDYEGPSIKTIEMKCDGCLPFGSVWEITTTGDLTTKAQFLKSLFRDRDHR